MSKKKQQPRQGRQTPPESDYGLDQWAKELVAAIGKRQARSVLKDYRALSQSRRTTKHGRKLASDRAKAISRLV